MPFQQVPWYVRGCLCILAPRSQQQANDIYESGIKYLRAHKIAASIAHRHDFLLLFSFPAVLVSIECARVRGMAFFFGIAFPKCMTLCCKKWCAFTPNTLQFCSNPSVIWESAPLGSPPSIEGLPSPPCLDLFLKQLRSICTCNNFSTWHVNMGIQALIGDSGITSWKKIKWNGRSVPWNLTVFYVASLCSMSCAYTWNLGVWGICQLASRRNLSRSVLRASHFRRIDDHDQQWLPKFQWHIIWCALTLCGRLLALKRHIRRLNALAVNELKKKQPVRPERETLAPTAVLCVCCWSWDGGWFGDGGWYLMGIVYSYHLCCWLYDYI